LVAGWLKVTNHFEVWHAQDSFYKSTNLTKNNHSGTGTQKGLTRIICHTSVACLGG